jgi:hypothetical protein
MILFLTPALLINGLTPAASFIFKNNGTQHCLYSNCSTTLAPTATYDTKDNGGATNHGLYFPTVSSQSELALNYGMFSASGLSNTYIWFQPNDDGEMVLTQSGSLNYGGGSPVTIGSVPVVPTNIGGARLALIDGAGGTIVIVGVIDSEDDSSQRQV